MAFSPFARFRNFTKDNLKGFLDVYPDMALKMSWDDAKKDIEVKKQRISKLVNSV